MLYIFYSGVGSKESTIHSVEEFLNIMKNAPVHYYEMIYLGFNMEYKNYSLPGDFINFTLEELLEYSGAEYYNIEW